MCKYFTIYTFCGLVLLLVTNPIVGAAVNRQFLARQQAAATAAPYPSAGITPEIPFDLPTETTPQPSLIYGPPDPTYGAPPDSTYGPPINSAADVQPELTYGTPALDADTDVPVGNADLPSQNIIQPRSRQARPIKLRLEPKIVEIIRSEPVLVYTL